MEPNYQHISRWTRADNYMGDDYSDYYVIAETNRDADGLMDSNFSAIKKTLGDKGIEYIDIRFNHWAVGWIEQLMVHQDNADGLKLADELNASIEDYPILDDDDYNERMNERVQEYYKDFKNSGHSAFFYFGEESVRSYMRDENIKRVRDLKKRNILEIIEGWWMD